MEIELTEIIALVIVVAGLILLFSVITQTYNMDTLKNLPWIIEKSEYLYDPGILAIFNNNENILYIVNKGNQLLTIDKIVIKSMITNEIYVEETTELHSSNGCVFSNTVIAPGFSTEAFCAGHIPLAVIGIKGEYVPISFIYEREKLSTSLNETNLLENRLSYSINEQGLYIDESLMFPTKTILQTTKSSSLHFGLNTSMTNTSIVAKIRGNNIIVVKDPYNNSRMNILISGGDVSNTDSYLHIGNQRINLKDDRHYLRYRLVIWGFIGEITNVTTISRPIPITKPGLYTNATLYLNGYAEKVSYYTSLQNQRYLGYEPYFIYGDLFDTGIPSFIFSTIDYWTLGNENIFNDFHPNFVNEKALDYSFYPLRVILTGFPINSSKASYIRLTIKLWLLDNSINNIGETPSNYDLFRVGIYDLEQDNYVYNYATTYHELQRYEGYGYIKEYVIPIPKTIDNKVYYVAFDIIDPYEQGVGNTINDIDFTLIVDYIGVTLGAS